MNPFSRPYLTPELPGIGGELKRQPEDFIVEELPAYPPCGEGEHLFLWIEKRDLSAERLTAHVARTLKISTAAVGTAGLKDRRAVTRQYVSVPASCRDRVELINSDAVRVLDHALHRHKLRTGHQHGNRFEILLRDPAPQATEHAQAIAAVIDDRGFPNFYGQQRYGAQGDTAALGFDLLSGRKSTHDVEPKRRRFLLRLSLSAAQSAIFDRVLANRIVDGLLHRVLPGDVMQVVASGGCFVAEDVESEQARFDARETVVTGPMPGPRMKAAERSAGKREAAALAEFGVDSASFATFAKLTPGTRRPLVAWPADFSIEPVPEGLWFRFSLPSGVYATTLLREFQKPTSEPD